ncbi:DUF1491 family protein [Nitratireductor mangrovi]|uniref:DUF1491 family protein n=1 Tax=Nitratireductor mangrovi TaxID=2599600 RepID=A0A5B8KZR0_9HYPH|nr:DUF1491 family protein [Nitratireductor mangrovi]QDZ01099.1 DUF1491 family protein [Nitratireductor mangrovi]
MRLRSDIFVAALTKRAFAAGGFAAVLNRGASEAGAIFVVFRDRLGGATLYGPAPQTGYADNQASRLFAQAGAELDEEALGKKLERELRFDPDAWVVELEVGLAADQLIDVMTP